MFRRASAPGVGGQEGNLELGDVLAMIVRDAAEHVADKAVSCDELPEDAAYRLRIACQAPRQFGYVGAGESPNRR